jgi:hypothetical protein
VCRKSSHRNADPIKCSQLPESPFQRSSVTSCPPLTLLLLPKEIPKVHFAWWDLSTVLLSTDRGPSFLLAMTPVFLCRRHLWSVPLSHTTSIIHLLKQDTFAGYTPFRQPWERRVNRVIWQTLLKWAIRGPETAEADLIVLCSQIRQYCEAWQLQLWPIPDRQPPYHDLPIKRGLSESPDCGPPDQQQRPSTTPARAVSEDDPSPPLIPQANPANPAKAAATHQLTSTLQPSPSKRPKNTAPKPQSRLRPDGTHHQPGERPNVSGPTNPNVAHTQLPAQQGPGLTLTQPAHKSFEECHEDSTVYCNSGGATSLSALPRLPECAAPHDIVIPMTNSGARFSFHSSQYLLASFVIRKDKKFPSRCGSLSLSLNLVVLHPALKRWKFSCAITLVWYSSSFPFLRMQTHLCTFQTSSSGDYSRASEILNNVKHTHQQLVEADSARDGMISYFDLAKWEVLPSETRHSHLTKGPVLIRSDQSLGHQSPQEALDFMSRTSDRAAENNATFSSLRLSKRTPHRIHSECA